MKVNPSSLFLVVIFLFLLGCQGGPGPLGWFKMDFITRLNCLMNETNNLNKIQEIDKAKKDIEAIPENKTNEIQAIFSKISEKFTSSCLK